MNVTIVDYKSGNISSVINSFKEVAENKVKIDVNTEDKVGVLSDLGSVFAKSGINIGSVNTKTIDKKFAGFEIQIEVKNKEELKSIMQKVRSLKFTTSCKRNINDK